MLKLLKIIRPFYKRPKIIFNKNLFPKWKYYCLTATAAMVFSNEEKKIKIQSNLADLMVQIFAFPVIYEVLAIRIIYYYLIIFFMIYIFLFILFLYLCYKIINK